jgi:hypothetical protein
MFNRAPGRQSWVYKRKQNVKAMLMDNQRVKDNEQAETMLEHN